VSYIVFARKWRPQTFDEIIGQEHITTTLKNAIKQGRVAHAYLFCGPRGIGKTTTARILAKALNCEKGPTPNPCNNCISCKEITEGRSLDILEIDGASNNGVDEIRNLKDNVKFFPAHGKFKIYIIDEVHMLTPEAFNALLKTLEEPPPHVKFIFATTAPHKVIPTILSRCQRFNFHRLSAGDMVKKLKVIAEKEKIDIDDTAIFNIVRAASGSMRDAESLLDQLATYCKNSVAVKDINKLLGIVEQDTLSEFSQSIIDRDTAAAIKLINKLVDEGVDPAQFIQGLIEYFRCAMIIKEGKELAGLLELTKDEIDAISKHAQALTTEDILYILYSLINTNYSIRKSPSPRIPLELLAVKLTRKESIVSLEEIMRRLAALEKEISAKGAEAEGTQKVKEGAPVSGIPIKNQPPAENPQINNMDINTPQTPEPPQSLEPQAALYRIREIMPQVIKNIKQEKIYIASCLSEGKLIDFRDNILTIGFFKKHSFHKESLEKAQNKKIIEEHLLKLLNYKVRAEFVIIKDEEEPASAEKATADKKGKEQESPFKKAVSDPIIKSALDIFDGNIMKFI
jgi:DNA polymerase-3 subunit gamma/tau